MSDVERVLSQLIHDLRTPLGVAHGYLRMVRDQKLAAPEDREKALAGTQQALSTMSRLCADASAFLDGGASGDGPAVRAAAAALAERVSAVVHESGIMVRSVAIPDGSISAGTSLDRLADAIGRLLLARKERPAGAIVRIGAAGGELTFDWGGQDEVGPVRASMDEQPFDPWQSRQGLSVALAHRIVTNLGGRVWTRDGTTGIGLPMETGDS
jgi:signal transduction histidine kinase